MRDENQLEEALAALADRQAGRVARRQLIEIGYKPAAIGRLVDKKRLRKRWRGVYTVGHTASTRHEKLWEGILIGGEKARVTARAAAVIRGWLATEGRIVDIVTPRQVQDRGDFRFRQTEDLPGENVHGVPVTTPARTLVDLARRASDATVARAVDQALAQAELTLDDLPDRLPASLRRAVEAHRSAIGYARSEFDDLLTALLDGRSLRMPDDRNVAITAADGTALEVDAIWYRERVVVELQSWSHHRSRLEFENDHRKAVLLELMGYTVLQFTWRQLVHEPELAGALIAEALRRAAAA